MSEKENDAILLFDTLYTTNHIQILKILLQCFSKEEQHKIAVYIKLKELQYTMEYTGSSALYLTCQEKSNPSPPDFTALYKQIQPYCTQQEKEMLEKIMNMKNNMEKYREMMSMMQILEPMFKNAEGGSMDNILHSFLSEEQMAMFQMFQGEK